MINLLPTETKQNYLYARRNTHLVRWIFGISVGIVGIAIVIVLGMLYINQSITSYNQQLAEGQERLKIHKLADSQKQVEEISSNLKLVVQVLSKEILFSKMIQKIGAAMPPGAVLTGLSIDKAQGGIDLQAQATNYQTATQIQVNLADAKNQVFEKADINQIQCSQASSDDSSGSSVTLAYPCRVSIRALFGSNNPYLFINNTTPTGTAAQ